MFSETLRGFLGCDDAHTLSSGSFRHTAWLSCVCVYVKATGVDVSLCYRHTTSCICSDMRSQSHQASHLWCSSCASKSRTQHSEVQVAVAMKFILTVSLFGNYQIQGCTYRLPGARSAQLLTHALTPHTNHAAVLHIPPAK